MQGDRAAPCLETWRWLLAREGQKSPFLGAVFMLRLRIRMSLKKNHNTALKNTAVRGSVMHLNRTLLS